MGKNTYTMDNETDSGAKLKDDEQDSGNGSRPGSDARPVSALARGVQITEFAESRVNPTPFMLEESDILLEQFLSPGKLQTLTGVDNLEQVESLELKVDSRETSLGNFGHLLPNLRELKLSGSSIANVRDLGSSLRVLRVLWLTRCGLLELDGITAMFSLRELYLEYNELEDISPLSMLEDLEILDLEGNNIDDITQVQYLSLCPKLRRLALDGNPICACASPESEEVQYDYRAAVKKLLPNLLVLDDERLDTVGSSLTKTNVFEEDWAYLEELQRDAFLQGEFGEEEEALGQPQSDRPTTAALGPATNYRPGSALRPSSGFRPMSASRRPQTLSSGGGRPGTTVSVRPISSDNAPEGIESSSALTMGNVICGNPSKALRQRRSGGAGSKEDIQKSLSRLMQKGAVYNQPEEVDNTPFKEGDEMNSIIDELQSWKVDHEKRMEEILKTKEAQVLRIDHDEAEDVLDSDEDLDLGPRPSSAARHSADLRLKATRQTLMETAQTSPRRPASSSKSRPDSSKKKRSQPNPNKSSSASKIDNSTLDTSWSPDGLEDPSRRKSSFSPEDYDREELSPAAMSPSFSSSHPLAKAHRWSREGSMGDMFSESHDPMSMDRPRSRGQGEGSRAQTEPLGPLRAPSPTSAQIIGSMRARPLERPPSPSRKLRVGPTGLPTSSTTPVIRNSIVPPLSRPGLVPSSASSRQSMTLLPSQPRIPRQLPQPPGQALPHPPRQT